MAGYRSLKYGTQKLFLRGRLAFLWGVQVVVFPAYVAVQSIRTGYRRLQTQHPLQKLTGLLAGKPVQDLTVTADTPIRALLSVIRPQAAPQGGGLRPVNYHGAFLRQSHAGGVLTNGGWHLVQVKQPIRGIASDLRTRRLVLVTTSNSIFEALTEDQQSRLERAIALLVAEYASQQNRHYYDRLLQQPGLPLPKAEPTQWPVVRWLHQGMRWMQTGGLAVLTNLFGEADQRARHLVLKESRTSFTFPTQAESEAYLRPREVYWLHPKAHLPADIAAVVAGQMETESSVKGIALPKDSFSPLSGRGRSNLERNDSRQVAVSLATVPPAEDTAKFSWPLEADILEVRVSQVHYIDTWFVQLLRWIDQGLLWLEQSAKHLWVWLRRLR